MKLPAEKMVSINLEIDLHLAKYWALMDDSQEFTRDEMARYMRASYAQGYKDAMNDPEPGKWAIDLGFDLQRSG